MVMAALRELPVMEKFELSVLPSPVTSEKEWLSTASTSTALNSPRRVPEELLSSITLLDKEISDGSSFTLVSLTAMVFEPVVEESSSTWIITI